MSDPAGEGRPERPGRDAYAIFRPIQTRWQDNDVYAHVNNVVYYSYFDTVVNGWLMERGLLTLGVSPAVGLVVETGCAFFAEVAFPDRLEGGLAVVRAGRTSVTYRVGVFREGEAAAAAAGHFVHVYVDAASRRPTPLSPALREALADLEPSTTG